MFSGTATSIMPAMTRPTPAPKLFLIADRRPVGASAPDMPIRRFRLARLGLDANCRSPKPESGPVVEPTQ